MKPTEQQRRAGERMKQAAADRGWNAYEVAKRLDVRPPTVYRWFRGSRPGQALLEQFAALVEREVAEFYAGPDSQGRDPVALLVRWARHLLAGDTNAGAMQQAGMATEDLSTAELELLKATEAGFRDDLQRASAGRWATLSDEERALVLQRLIAELDASPKEGDQPPPPAPKPRARRK